jgi:hypothetical protein
VVGVSDPSTTDTDRDLVYVDGWPDRLFGNVLHDGPDGQCIYIYAGIEERCPNDPVAWTHFNGKPIEMCAEHCPVDVPEPPSTEQQELVTDGGVDQPDSDRIPDPALAAAKAVAEDHGGTYTTDEPCVEDHPGFGTAKICLPKGGHSILEDLAERGCRVCEVYGDPDCYGAGHETAVYIEHEAAGTEQPEQHENHPDEIYQAIFSLTLELHKEGYSRRGIVDRLREIADRYEDYWEGKDAYDQAPHEKDVVFPGDYDE